RSALPASHCGGIPKRSVSFANVSREIGRTLPTTPWKRPTSTPLPETWTSSHDGSGRPSRAVRVRSHVPTTGGGAGSCAESDDITTRVAVRIDAWRIIRRAPGGGLECQFTDLLQEAHDPVWYPKL